MQLARLVELHDGDAGCHHLGHRGHVEDGVEGHRLGCGELAVEAGFAGQLAHAVGLLEDDLAAVADDDDRARQLLLRDGCVDGGGDGGEVGDGLRLG